VIDMWRFYNKNNVYNSNKEMFDNISDLMIMEYESAKNRQSKRAHKIHNIIVRYVDKYIKEFENPFLFDYEMNEKEFLSIVNTQTEYREIWKMDKDHRQIFLERVTNFCY
jgi:hypothetical protein